MDRSPSIKSNRNTLYKLLMRLFKLAVLLLAGGYIFYVLHNHQDLSTAIHRLLSQMVSLNHALLLLGLVLLIAVNWGLEAKAWQVLLQNMAVASTYFQALKGVLAGISASFFAGTTLGSYAGRTWQLSHQRRFGSWLPILVGSLCLSYSTYLAGSLGLVQFLAVQGTLPNQFHTPLLLAVLIGVGGGGLYLLLHLEKATQHLQRLPPWLLPDRFRSSFSFPPRTVAKVVVILAGRYLAFSLQMGLALLLFGVELPLAYMASGISLVFMAKTFLPNINFLADLGIREATAVFFFSSYGVAELPVMGATLLLWLVNIALPALAGLFFYWQLPPEEKKTATVE